MVKNQTDLGRAGAVNEHTACKRATVAVVWSDRSVVERLPQLVCKLSALHPSWAVAGSVGGDRGDTMHTCHTLEEARRWLQCEHGLIWLLNPSHGEGDECLALSLALDAGAEIVPVYVAAESDGGIRVGSPVSPATLERFTGELQQVALLRWRGQALRYGPNTRGLEPVSMIQEPVAPPVCADVLAAEIDRLPNDCKLLESADCCVYAGRAIQIPSMLREIGRQRELTFRAAGEGTGRAEDLDAFDHDYHHLFAYSKKHRCLMGAYRLGLVDELMEHRGLLGLYTSTLFRFAPDLFDHLGPTIELGRSFVGPQFQKNSRALIWLWKGIARFVAARPAYRTLLGPVSVSADYGSFSREVMVRVLSGTEHRHWLHESVRAKHPVLARSFGTGGLGDPRAVLRTLADLQAVVSDAESDRKGIPVLVKEYIKLGGKFLDFNLDPEFSNVIDGLVVVDLLQTDRRMLAFYMGKLLDQFLDCHRASA